MSLKSVIGTLIYLIVLVLILVAMAIVVASPNFNMGNNEVYQGF
jgi:hypothetical protein